MRNEKKSQERISSSAGSNLLSIHSQYQNLDATIYVGNIDLQADEEILWELFTQVGPVVNVCLPKDRITGSHQGYGFVEFKTITDAEYALKILNMIRIFNKPLRINKRSSQNRSKEYVGANLYVGNLDPLVDEKVLFDTFSAFGILLEAPKIIRDPITGKHKGHAFLIF